MINLDLQVEDLPTYGLDIEELISEKITGPFCLPQDDKKNTKSEVSKSELNKHKCLDECEKQELCNKVRKILMELYSIMDIIGVSFILTGTLLDGSSHIDQMGLEVISTYSSPDDVLNRIAKRGNNLNDKSLSIDIMGEKVIMTFLKELPIEDMTVTWPKQSEDNEQTFELYYAFLALKVIFLELKKFFPKLLLIEDQRLKELVKLSIGESWQEKVQNSLFTLESDTFVCDFDEPFRVKVNTDSLEKLFNADKDVKAPSLVLKSPPPAPPAPRIPLYKMENDFKEKEDPVLRRNQTSKYYQAYPKYQKSAKRSRIVENKEQRGWFPKDDLGSDEDVHSFDAANRSAFEQVLLRRLREVSRYRAESPQSSKQSNVQSTLGQGQIGPEEIAYEAVIGKSEQEWCPNDDLGSDEDDFPYKGPHIPTPPSTSSSSSPERPLKYLPSISLRATLPTLSRQNSLKSSGILEEENVEDPFERSSVKGNEENVVVRREPGAKVNVDIHTYRTRLRMNREKLSAEREIVDKEGNEWVPRKVQGYMGTRERKKESSDEPNKENKKERNTSEKQKKKPSVREQKESIKSVLESNETESQTTTVDPKSKGKRHGIGSLVRRFERVSFEQQSSIESNKKVKKKSVAKKPENPVEMSIKKVKERPSKEAAIESEIMEEEKYSPEPILQTLVPPSPALSLQKTVAPNEMRRANSFQTGYTSHDDDYYPLDPKKKGLVLFFYQTEKRLGWEEDIRAVRDTFQNLLDCELREFKNCARWQMLQHLRELEDSFYNRPTQPPFDNKPYNFLIVIVAAHGGWDDKLGNYIKASGNVKISCREIEDKIINNPKMKTFSGLPKVIVWNACKGKHPRVCIRYTGCFL